VEDHGAAWLELPDHPRPGGCPNPNGIIGVTQLPALHPRNINPLLREVDNDPDGFPRVAGMRAIQLPCENLIWQTRSNQLNHGRPAQPRIAAESWMCLAHCSQATDMADALCIRGCQRAPDILIDLVASIVGVVVAAFGAADFDDTLDERDALREHRDRDASALGCIHTVRVSSSPEDAGELVTKGHIVMRTDVIDALRWHRGEVR